MNENKSKFIIGVIIALLFGIIIGLLFNFTILGDSRKVIDLGKDTIIVNESELTELVEGRIDKFLLCLDEAPKGKLEKTGDMGAAFLNCIEETTKYKSSEVNSQKTEYVISQFMYENNNIFTSGDNNDQKFIVLKWLMIRLILMPLIGTELNGGLPCEPWAECWEPPCTPWPNCNN